MKEGHNGQTNSNKFKQVHNLQILVEDRMCVTCLCHSKGDKGEGIGGLSSVKSLDIPIFVFW